MEGNITGFTVLCLGVVFAFISSGPIHACLEGDSGAWEASGDRVQCLVSRSLLFFGGSSLLFLVLGGVYSYLSWPIFYDLVYFLSTFKRTLEESNLSRLQMSWLGCSFLLLR